MRKPSRRAADLRLEWIDIGVAALILVVCGLCLAASVWQFHEGDKPLAACFAFAGLVIGIGGMWLAALKLKLL